MIGDLCLVKVNCSLLASVCGLLYIFSAIPHDTALADPAVPVYQDVHAPLEARVNDLYARLTPDEKLSLLEGTAFTSQPLPRLGIKGIQFADAGQGVRGTSNDTYGYDPFGGPATAFPAGVTMASSWDKSLVREIGQAIGEEAKNKGTGIQIELGPAVNIHRSPLDGRDSEYLSEDPYLNARLAVAYIDGMQSTGIGACIKHFACNNQETNRYAVNVVVDERTLREIYLPAFEAAVKEGHVRSVMAAYNKVNGPWCTANWYLLTNVLRTGWNYHGMVLSDWGAVHEVVGDVNAGMELEMPDRGYLSVPHLKTALAIGLIKQDSIDYADKDVLRAMILSGLADPVQPVPDHSVVGSPEHQALALKAATEGMVLLKNDGALLPLNPNGTQTIAIIGPRAKNWQMDAQGSPGVQPTLLVNAYDGIAQRLSGNGNTTLLYSAGQADFSGATIVPTSALTTPDGAQHGLSGTYFSADDLSGTPVVTRNDSAIDFNWPDPTLPTGVGPLDFSVRWTGNLTAPETGSYAFTTTVDDGCRLWIGNNLIVDHWTTGSPTPVTGFVDLVAGRTYPVKLEYFQDTGTACIHLAWTTPSNALAPYSEAVDAARKADTVIVIVGSEREAEASDRSSMDMPDAQDGLIRAVASVNPRTVVVLNNGGPVLLSTWINSAPAVVEAGFPGELGGKALASVLFGDVNPSGKLVDTYGVRREDYPDYGNYPDVDGVVHYAEGIYVGYRAFDKRGINPVYPFGYGLSYTKFRYSALKLETPGWTPSGTLTVTANVENVGKVEGAEVAELYIEPKNPKIDRPIRELKGFDREVLAPGQTKTAVFVLTPRDFAYCDVPGKQWRSDAGNYAIEVGGSSRDLSLVAPITLTRMWTEPIPGLGASSPYVTTSSLSTGKPASASSVTQGNLAAYAFDNDPGTRWESDHSDPQWLVVDLAHPTTFSRVLISWETAYSNNYQLQVSDDNSAWRTVYNNTNGSGGLEQFTFPPVTARYVRLYMLQRATQFGDSLYSFDIYAK
jgi:beta-glucosidase